MNDCAALSRPYLTTPPGLPWLIGLIHVAAGAIPYELSRRDVERDTAWALRIYRELGLEAGGTVHLVGDGTEEVCWWAFQAAAMNSGIPWIEAEGGSHDAARTDMVVRRFKLQAVIGLSEPVLDAMQALGRDPVQYFGSLRALVARPGADARLRALGIHCWTQHLLGPLFAFESAPGEGARYDETEWRVDSLDGELAVTAVNDRASPFVRLRTGQRGRVEAVTGAAGSERRIHFE